MNKYKFEMNMGAWLDEDVSRAPSKIIYEGGGETIDAVVADFKDWLLACTFHPGTVDRVIINADEFILKRRD